MRTLSCCLVVLVVGWSCATPNEEPQEPSGAVLYEGARLIVGDGTVIEDSAFLVENNAFSQVGRRGDVPLPGGAVRVDLEGKTVMPTLIDGHNHLGYSNVRTGTTAWENYTREHLIENLERMAYYGVGMSMSLGNDGGHGDLPFRLRDERLPTAARLMTTGGGISTPGGGQGGARANSWTTVRTEEEARKAVQELAPHKPNAVKIWVDDRDIPGSSMPSAIQRAVIDEAHKHGLRVAGHANYLRHVKELVRNGVDGLTHMVRDRDHEVDEELMSLLRERPGIYILPVLPPPGDGDPGYVEADVPWIGETLPPSRVTRLRDALATPNPNQEGGDRYTRGAKSYSVQAHNLIKLKKSGLVRIGFGTDGTGGWTAHTELADMVLAGLTRMEVIVAATSTSADILQADDVGSVAAGKSADFIVLDANPLENITNTRRINKVYLRGKEVNRAAVRARLAREP